MPGAQELQRVVSDSFVCHKTWHWIPSLTGTRKDRGSGMTKGKEVRLWMAFGGLGKAPFLLYYIVGNPWEAPQT